MSMGPYFFGMKAFEAREQVRIRQMHRDLWEDKQVSYGGLRRLGVFWNLLGLFPFWAHVCFQGSAKHAHVRLVVRLRRHVSLVATA